MTKECACGCGSTIPLFDARGRKRADFLRGHHNRTEAGRLKISQNKTKLTTKICIQCHGQFDRSSFEYAGKLRNMCETCRHVSNQMYRYKISREEATRLLDTLNCEICGDVAVHTDHDHKTGAIRGRLCARCNQGLGYFKDNPDWLVAAAGYLLKSQDVLGAVANVR